MNLSNAFNVLHAYTFHILSTSGINVTIFSNRFKGWYRPSRQISGDDIVVRIQQENGQRRVFALPFGHNDG